MCAYVLYTLVFCMINKKPHLCVSAVHLEIFESYCSVISSKTQSN